MIGYPYTYGDESKGITNVRLHKLLAVICLSSLILTPSCVAFAQNVDANAILDKVEKLIKKNEEAMVRDAGIHPLSAAACVGAGYCIAKTKESIVSGKFETASAWACGALTFYCSEQVFRYVN